MDMEGVVCGDREIVLQTVARLADNIVELFQFALPRAVNPADERRTGPREIVDKVDAVELRPSCRGLLRT